VAVRDLILKLVRLVEIGRKGLTVFDLRLRRHLELDETVEVRHEGAVQRAPGMPSVESV